MRQASRFPDAPPNVQALPTDHRGFPVPWFVAWIDGKADFRVIGPGRVEQAVKKELCWICGRPMGAMMRTFVIGPMCAVNRVSPEPPSHWQCAVFAATACPFLSQPKMRRNDKGLPEERQPPPGLMIERNPGVALVWGCSRFKRFHDDLGGLLFEVGPPRKVAWYAQGRAATRDECLHSIETGLPILEQAAAQDGPLAEYELRVRLRRAMQLLPKAA